MDKIYTASASLLVRVHLSSPSQAPPAPYNQQPKKKDREPAGIRVRVYNDDDFAEAGIFVFDIISFLSRCFVVAYCPF